MPDVEQMVRRQRVLADFGDLALRSESLDEVLTEACRLVGEALGTLCLLLNLSFPTHENERIWRVGLILSVYFITRVSMFISVPLRWFVLFPDRLTEVCLWGRT